MTLGVGFGPPGPPSPGAEADLGRGHRHLADIYLLGLAARMRGRLVTFDRTIPCAAVVGAGPDTLEVVCSTNPE